MDKQDNSLVNKFLKQISKIIDHKLEKLTTVESAIVDQVNIDGSVNLHIPPDSTIFTGVQNQSIYQNLKVGDCVKVLKQNNKASNMWIIGGHNLKRNDTIEKINKVVSNITDFIVEQDISGIWTYRKWNSGVAECWCSYNLTIPINNGFGHEFENELYTHYYGVIAEKNFPTGLFVETPHTILSVTDNNGNIFGIKKHSNKYTTGDMYALSPVSLVKETVYVDIEAKGRWK